MAAFRQGRRTARFMACVVRNRARAVETYRVIVIVCVVLLWCCVSTVFSCELWCVWCCTTVVVDCCCVTTVVCTVLCE